MTASDPRLAALLDALRRSFDGAAWHGPALADALDGVDARTAAARPIPGAHSIWELTRHLSAWAEEVARRLEGARPAQPAAGDWPPAPAGDEVDRSGEWAAARAALGAARARVLAALAAFPPARLDAPLPPADDPAAAPDALGTRHSYAGMAAGLAEHNAYHGGQIVLLRRALERPSAASPNADPS